MQQPVTARGDCAGGEVTAFNYPACNAAPAVPAWDGWVEVSEVGNAKTPNHEHQKCHDGASAHAAQNEQPSEESRRSFEVGRERGRQEGREAEREAQATSLAAEAERRKRQLADVIEKFAQDRDRYLNAVEREVVRLAMAIAARILRREAQMDPLLLTGAVRVALGQLAASCEVCLKVPAAEMALWTEAIALVPNLSTKPTIVAGDGMRLGDCVIESKVGTVDLGVRSQLGEIERGFFDRSSAGERVPAAPPDDELLEAQK